MGKQGRQGSEMGLFWFLFLDFLCVGGCHFFLAWLVLFFIFVVLSRFGFVCLLINKLLCFYFLFLFFFLSFPFGGHYKS